MGDGKHLYMNDHLIAAYGMCSSYSNVTACQSLANMCTLLYARDQTTDNLDDACKMLRSVKSPLNPKGWYWYTTYAVLEDSNAISYQFQRNSLIDIFVAIYSMNGTFIALQSVTNGVFSFAQTKQYVRCLDITRSVTYLLNLVAKTLAEVPYQYT
jgi:hypothetical protein